MAITAGITLVSHLACALPRASVPPDRITVNVLVLNFDPPVDGRPLHAANNWHDPRTLASAYADDIRTASHGVVNFAIVEWREIPQFPIKADGFRYRSEQYERNQRAGAGWHEPDAADYRQLFAEQHVAQAVDAGIDEIWLFGGPYFGFSESAMAGPGAFYINGGVFDDVGVKQPFAVMGFNYERGVAEMLESLCHRTEDTMRRVYGGWRAEVLDHDWARFAANTSQSGSAAVGSCHWPPNAEREYDWDNPRSVASTAAGWLRYPDVPATTSPVNRETWGGPDYAHNYFHWWFAHLPHATGVNGDGRLNNWWRYVWERRE